VRIALLLTATIACSTNGKREDSAPPAPPSPAPHAGDTAGPYTGPKVVIATPDGDTEVKVEVVATEPKIQKGLMYRRHLPLDAGMLFLMDKEREWPFWMRNTLIPLDMLFIGSDMKVVGIVENAEPLTETLRTVGKPSLYVLEVNGGWSKAHHVGAGAPVRFENVPPRS
jgi:uncharacterized membrane protein (UPF0127 family)